MDGQDEGAIVGDGEVFRVDGDALPFQLGDFGLQGPGVEHDAVADDRQRAAHDAAGQQAELVDRAIDHQRMAGVVAALKAHDHIGAAGQPVDDLALALIAPLGADHGHVGHGSRTLSVAVRSRLAP